MPRLFLLLMGLVGLSACVTRTPHPSQHAPAFTAWDQRVLVLQRVSQWRLTGRAAVAVGTQGWQASLDWQQTGMASEVRLSGPLGLGALVLERTPQGLSLNGAAPSDAVVAQLEDKLGFELPIDNLRYWLLGIADPARASEVVRNDQDRAQQLAQAGWSVLYDRYMAVDGDLLPAHLVLSREGVRVRIAVDHWDGLR